MYTSGGSPTVTNVAFSGNSARNAGGMYNDNSSPTLTDVTFSGNSASLGGAMLNTASTPTLTDVTFSGNSASLSGAGMFNTNSSHPTLTNVTFSGNSATQQGGGMLNSSSNPTLTNVTFSGNSASNDSGGGMVNLGSSPTLTDVTFSGNSSAIGGGMYNSNSNPELTNVTFSDNPGGGMHNSSSNPKLTNVTFSDNPGGGMVNLESSPTLTNATFSGNSGLYGGGMLNYLNSNPTLTDVSFSGNSASQGAGIYNYQSSPTLTNATFSGNSASQGGGGMYNYQSSPALTNATFSDNSGLNGGGMYNDESGVTLTNVTFSGNRANYIGGGMINLGSSPTLINMIIANSAGGDCVNFGGVGSLNAASASNLIEDAANACGLTNGVAGNIVGSDPNLAALADNGGSTQTHALLAGSPAIDAGDDASCPSTDQRGQARPQGSHCDIGAYEAEAHADTTPPLISPDVSGTLGDNGWYVGDVSLSWSVVDNESGITSSTGCDPLSITSDQPETAYTCQATSAGGTNSATATIKRDATPPAVSVTGVTDGATYVLGSVPTAGCDTTDAVSGAATAASLSVSGGNALGVGSFSATCDGARDNAGNASNTASVHYTVTFLFTGFSAPVDNNGVLNIAKAGQPIPLKWRITDANGNPVANLASVTVTATSLSCSAGTTTDQIEEYATGASGLQNLGNGYYQWNWKSPTSYANSCKALKLDLGEGAGFEHVALFQFKK